MGKQTNYQRQFGGSGGSGKKLPTTKAEQAAFHQARRQELESLERKFRISVVDETTTRRGWLYNICSTSVLQDTEVSGVDLYFMDDAGSFKTTIVFRPYLYLLIHETSTLQLPMIHELLMSSLFRKFDSIHDIQVVEKLDLDQPNHLSPISKPRSVLKVVFDSTKQMVETRSELFRLVSKNAPSYQEIDTTSPFSYLAGLREYDVPYIVRVCTDLNIRAGTWYTIQNNELVDPDNIKTAHPTILAFDIECTKAPLKFPNADVDEIFMISYMVSLPDGGVQGYLIVSRTVVSQDIDDFEYTPQPEYPGPFTIFNEVNEKALLDRFFSEYQRLAPHICVTYNGDFFDWPFVEARAAKYGMSIRDLGMFDNYRGRSTVNLDAFSWVQRDSYLPQGAQGLKAVTKYKLGYDPVEVDPEDMVKFATTQPVKMATYSVSDAVATYYLYVKYVHLFTFSLATIIPMGPEDVISKGSGTLCESLLMVQACQKDIICPNKEKEVTKFRKGHLVESETYIGGKVECLETGVYRSDIEYDFDLKPAAFQQLIDNVERDLKFAVETENLKVEDAVNYETIKAAIIEQLSELRDNPIRKEKPYIYHLDVSAMYPNIILTNRLQPNSIVDDAVCASCDYNRESNRCKRRMDWVWRGDYSPANRTEYERAKAQLQNERFEDGTKSFYQLPKKERDVHISNRLKTYARRAYNKTKITEEETRTQVVCMRENDFYVDTVRQFRDRRYEFKRLNKLWKKKAKETNSKECADRVLVYDSLQVAHKCILNSFYGYVMRKGARWRSMEMAGIVTKTGADIITQARRLVEQVGRPLELDTDGIWCILPGCFPDTYTFEFSNGATMKLEYPCVMLNADVHNTFTNHQYQELENPERGIYKTHSECSIYFEVDGPYRCMVLPASTEEGKLLKKRYAVFNFDGSLAELKGFELKRRGELELIKTFQSQVFERFLEGEDLTECYDAVADVANHWIDVIDTRGESLDDDELVDLISENRNMSRQLDDYGDQKGTSQTTARRLGEFLGAEIIKDKGLNCKFIIAEQPFGAPVTDRAIPTAIWKAEDSVMKHYLRKWLRSPGLDGDALDLRNILDWDYYLDRLGKSIQKIITIPAALQKVPNPVPRVAHPDWLLTKVQMLTDRFQQRSIKSMFKKKTAESATHMDIEDIGGGAQTGAKRPLVHKMRRKPEAAMDVDEQPEKRAVLSKDAFPDWLKQKKSLWRRRRRELRADKKAGGTGKKQRKAVSIEGFVGEAAKSLVENEWHILEVREMSSFETSTPGLKSATGDFIVWAMVGKSIQKFTMTVPRIVYVASGEEIAAPTGEVLGLKKVEKHLPYNCNASYVYEIKLRESDFLSGKWLQHIKSAKDDGKSPALETLYEGQRPLISRVLSEMGAVAKLDTKRSAKSYFLEELSRIDQPANEYLHSGVTVNRFFLYVRVSGKTKTGVVALFRANTNEADISRPSRDGKASFDVGATVALWVVKPKAKNSQKSVSQRQCNALFKDVLESVTGSAEEDSQFSAVAPGSCFALEDIKFVSTERQALAGANEMIHGMSKTLQGPTLIALNSNRPDGVLRRYMSTFTSFPVVFMAFPPGPAHDPAVSTLPSLNWEQPAIQLSMEAYLYMQIVAFPKRVSYSRYGRVPIGNLGQDENMLVYDVSFSRLLEKNRAVSWASPTHYPDLGIGHLPGDEGGNFPLASTSVSALSQDEIWGEDDELISPVVRRPGCYWSVCVDIDVQDLAIAALTNANAAAVLLSAANGSGNDPPSPTSVTMFSEASSKTAGPLGDEMSTSVSLPMLRALVGSWLKDAFQSQSVAADELLHHVYRLVSNPETLLHDPALHRVVHSLMKSTFFKLLSELQRLGCSVVFASFNKITVATNKLEMSGAEEYINFVIETVRKRSSDEGDVLAKLSLRPRQFHCNFVFLDEYNFGMMHLERVHESDIEESHEFTIPDLEHDGHVIVPSIVTAWSIMNYLGSELAQEYFRVILGRFSRDVLKKQVEILTDKDIVPIAGSKGLEEPLLEFKNTMISKHFASYLTRAVGEIQNEGTDEDILSPYATPATKRQNPSLEFIKTVIAVLELDTDLERQVQGVKRGLLSQLRIAEYSDLAKFVNPCPVFILPDVFCMECQESRDLNLCYIAPRQEEIEKTWFCEDCGSPYSIHDIQDRLCHILQKKLVRYSLQDIRCVKSGRVASRVLAPQLEVSAGLKLDIEQKEITEELTLLRSIATLHGLEKFESAVNGVLSNFQLE